MYVAPPTGARYRLTPRLIALGNDYWIEDSQGQRAFFVDGKVLRLRTTLEIQDAYRRPLVTIRRRLMRLRETFEIVSGPTVVATIRRPLATILRDRLDAELWDGSRAVVQGNLLGHEYRVDRGGVPMGLVSERFFSLRGSYGVDVHPGHDVVLMLAFAVCVDVMVESSD